MIYVIPYRYHLMEMECVLNDTPVRLKCIYTGIEAQRDTYEKQRSNRCDSNLCFFPQAIENCGILLIHDKEVVKTLSMPCYPFPLLEVR